MALLILAGDRHREVHPSSGRAFSLEELQKMVGGYIEALYFDDGRIMFVNEEGKLQGMPMNFNATTLARTQSRYRTEVIVGNAVVCSRTEAGAGEEREEC